ncbi:MAG TPA: transglycosylase domain-containing protein [Bacteroidales bacterium]
MENLSDKQKKYLKIFWIIFLSPIILFFLIIFLVSMGWIGGEMPSFEVLDNPTKNLASEVYSNDGKILGTFYLDENRNNLEYKDLSPYVVQALIAREDHRFKKHSGIDGTGLLRVIGKTIMLGNKDQGGGSTITQQLAKNLFQRDTTDYRLGIVRKMVLALSKFREWVIAVKLERNYSKEEIISMYLNTVSFSSSAYGIKAASREFFNKSADSLKIEEAAMLVAMLKANTKFSPVRNPERAILRRNDVLQKMYEHDYITKNQLDSLIELPIKLDYHPQGHDTGLATYMREYLRNTMTRPKPKRSDYTIYKNYVNDSLRWAEDPLYGWCSKNLKPDGTKYNLYKDGLKIRTTINSRMQEYAEEAVREHLANTLQPSFFKRKKGNRKAPYAKNFTDEDIKKSLTNAMKQSDRYRKMRNAGYSEKEILANFKIPNEMRVFSWKGDIDTTLSPWDSLRYYKFFLRSSFMAVDPHTGYIKAYVGGPDYHYFKYDGAMVQKRQVGSTIKPFLYTLAMQEGYTPCDKVPNSPVTFKTPTTDNPDSTWTPKNSNPTKYDEKMVTLQWGLAFSVNNISAYLINKFKPQPLAEIIKKAGVKSDVPAVPALCLGVSELSLCELMGAYTIFPDKGVYTQPILVSRIEDKNGNLLTAIQPQKVEVISEHTAYLMLQMLRGVVRNGTASRLVSTYKLANEIGGKTGTTQNQSDGWFVGVTPDLIGAAWVGGDEPSIHFDDLGEGGGSAMALPIFGLFMQKIYADKKLNVNQGSFERPSGFNVNFNCPMNEEDSATEKNFLQDPF